MLLVRLALERLLYWLCRSKHREQFVLKGAMLFALWELSQCHAGELRWEHGESRAERIIAEELQRLSWTEADLVSQRKNAPGKLDLATRLRRETTRPLRWIAARIHLGTSTSATGKVHE